MVVFVVPNCWFLFFALLLMGRFVLVAFAKLRVVFWVALGEFLRFLFGASCCSSGSFAQKIVFSDVTGGSLILARLNHVLHIVE